MKKIGLIGGLGPEATVDYYKEIINAFKNGGEDLNYPEIIIYSVKMSQFLKLMNEKKYDQVISLLVDKLGSLKMAGAEFAAITANTPHMLFDQINERSPLPLISIVEAACKEAMKIGSKRPGLLGTGFTMNGSFFPDVFKKHNIEILVPEKEERELINNKLFTEIELGIFKDETRDMLTGVINRMVKEQMIDSVILGCTEFPLILAEESYSGIPVLNTTAIHVREIVEYCRQD